MKNTLDQVVLEIESKILASTTKTERAEHIYDWMQQNIAYDDVRRERVRAGQDLAYVTPEEILRRRKGICADQAVLYAAIGRRLRLNVDYASVDIGSKLMHAINIVETETGFIQVDTTNGIFGADYPNYQIKHPAVLQYAAPRPSAQPILSQLTRHYTHPRSSWWKPALIAAGVGAIVSLGVYLIPPMLKQRNVKYLETSESVKFITKHGNLEFTLDPDAKKLVKEAFFYTEAIQGDTQDKNLLAPYVKADMDGDNHFTKEEATDARDRARAEYLRSLD